MKFRRKSKASETPRAGNPALADFLLESAAAEAAWDAEIRDRIQAIDDGRVVGVPYEDVMRSAEDRLAQ